MAGAAYGELPPSSTGAGARLGSMAAKFSRFAVGIRTGRSIVGAVYQGIQAR